MGAKIGYDLVANPLDAMSSGKKRDWTQGVKGGMSILTVASVE